MPCQRSEGAMHVIQRTVDETLRLTYIEPCMGGSMMTPKLTQAVPLNELQRIKKWHVAHKADHPLEYHLWDAVLTLWLIGWIGWLPALALDEWWAMTLCAVAILAPRLYVNGRLRAHENHRLRCDWITCLR